MKYACLAGLCALSLHCAALTGFDEDFDAALARAKTANTPMIVLFTGSDWEGTDKGRRLKIYYMTQTSVAPPTFVVFCNSVQLFHFSYQRYIENCLRETFGFVGTPIKLIIRMKGDDAEG